jgi:hypothetical protein
MKPISSRRLSMVQYGYRRIGRSFHLTGGSTTPRRSTWFQFRRPDSLPYGPMLRYVIELPISRGPRETDKGSRAVPTSTSTPLPFASESSTVAGTYPRPLALQNQRLHLISPYGVIGRPGAMNEYRKKEVAAENSKADKRALAFLCKLQNCGPSFQ